MIKNIHYILFCFFFSIRANAFNNVVKIETLCVFLKHPLLFFFVGFLLTGIIGQRLIGKIQRKNWEHQFKVEKLNHQIKEARITYEHISLLLDKRIYRSRTQEGKKLVNGEICT